MNDQISQKATEPSLAAVAGSATCFQCANIGKVYDKGGIGAPHRLCGKSAERRNAYNERHSGLGFMENFRLFFDAHDNQKACAFFEPNNLAEGHRGDRSSAANKPTQIQT